MKPAGIGGMSPSGMQARHGVPGAPQRQASGSSEVQSLSRSGWASQTQPVPRQYGQSALGSLILAKERGGAQRHGDRIAGNPQGDPVLKRVVAFVDFRGLR